MPASLKLQEAFGDDLQVVFVEIQGATQRQAESTAVARRWMGGRAAWTIEPPFLTGATSLPYFVLLSSDGKVLLKGNPLSQSREIERLIADDLRKRLDPPPGSPPAVRAAWSDFQEDRVARAVAQLHALRAEPRVGAEVQSAAGAALEEIDRSVEARLSRAAAMIEHGYFDDASVELDTLRAAVQGDEERSARVRLVTDKLEAPKVRQERAMAPALQRLVARYYNSGGDGEAARELAAFAKEHPDTAAGARALHLAGLRTSASR